ncbi:hypothetical protein [Tateyamaria sp. SN3-11]|uniref:hypothetical protein n=1 Tax=Tateyamaria sp. SN3-11 TaxID=3092147 RepID=UPI0039EAEB20
MTRMVLSLMLSLLLVVTSHSAGMARGAERAVDQMVICIGAQAMVVYVDNEGQPTSAPHLCPDCALSAFVAPAPYAFVLGEGPAMAAPALWQSDSAVAQGRYARALARAPPV